MPPIDKINLKHQRIISGFTLIEILVSLTIMLVIGGLTIAGYQRFNSRQAVIQEAANIRSNLKNLQNQALVNEIPSACQSLIGYRMQFISDSYQTIALCGLTTPTPIIIKTYSLPETIEKETGDTFTVTFRGLGKPVEFTSGSNQVTIRHKRDTSIKRTISVSLSGEINIITTTPSPTPI